MEAIVENKALYIFNKEYEDIIFELSKGEGSTLSWGETVATIYNKPTSGRPRDIMIVRNLTNAVNYIDDLLLENKIFFDKETLCRINLYVSSGENFNNIGGFKVDEIKVKGTSWKGVSPSRCDEEFYNIVNKFHNQKIDNESIIKLCLKLCRCQFFGDGNKRTAQLIMNALLVKNNEVPFVINFKEKDNADALIRYYDSDKDKELFEIFLKKQKEIEKAYEFNKK